MNEEIGPIEDIARKFKQNSSESCLISSIMFSLALQFRDAEPTDAVLKDVRAIVEGRTVFRNLEYELQRVSVDISDLEDWTDEVNPRGYVEEIRAEKKQEKLRKYFDSGEYTVEMLRPSLDNLREVIKTRPLIYLLYPNQEFFAMLTPFYIQHVISAVAIEGNQLVYFEPLAGEIRKREMQLIEKLWKGGIGVVKKAATYQSRL